MFFSVSLLQIGFNVSLFRNVNFSSKQSIQILVCLCRDERENQEFAFSVLLREKKDWVNFSKPFNMVIVCISHLHQSQHFLPPIKERYSEQRV